MKEEYGWYTHDRRWLYVGRYGHTNDQIMPLLIPNWDELEKKVDELRLGCQALQDEGEGPEWHVYECAESALNNSFQRQARAYAFENIRFGTYQDRIGFRTVEFEGLSDALSINRPALLRFAKEKGFCLVFREVKIDEVTRDFLKKAL